MEWMVWDIVSLLFRSAFYTFLHALSHGRLIYRYWFNRFPSSDFQFGCHWKNAVGDYRIEKSKLRLFNTLMVNTLWWIFFNRKPLLNWGKLSLLLSLDLGMEELSCFKFMFPALYGNNILHLSCFFIISCNLNKPTWSFPQF